jgi:hypothetical protein
MVSASLTFRPSRNLQKTAFRLPIICFFTLSLVKYRLCRGTFPDIAVGVEIQKLLTTGRDHSFSKSLQENSSNVDLA